MLSSITHARRFFYIQDRLYNVWAMIDRAGAIVERYAYDAYGLPLIRESAGRGDMDSDTDLDSTDASRVASAVAGSIWDPRADLNDDGVVNSSDQTAYNTKKNSWPPTAFTGPTVAQAHSDVDNPFMFQGVRHFALDTPNATTANLPLNQHRLRFMEPWSGRWTTRDPIGYAGGTMNLYEALQSNLLLALDAFGLESFRQFIEDGHMDKHVQALWKRAKWYDREGTFWVLKGNRSRSPNRWGGPDHVRPTPIDQLSQEPLGHVHTHQRPEHAQGPSADKDIPEANKLGKPGVVLVRDPTNPRGFRLEFFGPGVDDPIPCASLFGNAVPGTKWTVGADGRCILEITDLEQMEEYYEERDRRREEYKRDREPDSYEKFYGGKTRPREPDSIEKRDRKRAQQCQRSS